MKNEILDEPFQEHEIFGDLLSKDEKILWRGSSINFKGSLYIINQDGTYTFSYKKLILKSLTVGIELIFIGSVSQAVCIF